jgi:hypothetical protein
VCSIGHWRKWVARIGVGVVSSVVVRKGVVEASADTHVCSVQQRLGLLLCQAFDLATFRLHKDWTGNAIVAGLEKLEHSLLELVQWVLSSDLAQMAAEGA